jgi:hypothetical protein
MQAFDVWPVCAAYRRAWQLLHQSRGYDGASGQPHPIPYTEMAAYAKDHGCTTEGELDEFIDLLQEQEQVFLKWSAAARAATSGTTSMGGESG